MKEVDVVQGSAEWLNLRCGKITGSNFDVLMPSPKQKDLPFNKTQKDYLYSVAAEILTGESEEDYQSYDMMRGLELEPQAAEYYSMSHLVKVRECGFFTDDIMIGVSPDRIVGDNEMVLEIKCPKAKTHVMYLDQPEQLFKKYKWQTLGEAYATGIKSVGLISFHPDFPDSKKMVEVEYTATDDDFKQLESRRKECVDFVKALVADPIDVGF